MRGAEDAPGRADPPDPVRHSGARPRPAGTWLRLEQAHDRITRQVDSVLHRRHGLSLTGFEALRRLADAPEERASMGELADALGLSRPGVTSTVERLVSDGLVRRERGAADRRVLHARLTPVGRERFAEAARTHDELVAHLLGPLGDDAAVVTEALARVSAAARTSD